MKSEVRVKSLLVLGLSLFAAPAFAQIHVTNGGGLAELKVIYLHQQLATFLQPCLGADNACALTGDERGDLVRLVGGHAGEARDVRIEFSESLPAGEILRTEPRPGAPLVVSSRALYAPSGAAFPVAELGAIVLAGRWSHVNGKPFAALIARTRLLFAGLRGDFAPLVLREQPPVLAHLPRLRFLSVWRQLVMIEDGRGTVDFTAAVVRALPACGPLEAWSLGNPRPFRRGDHLYATFEAAGSCAAGTVVIDLPLNGEAVLFDGARVDFRGSF